MTAYDNDKQDDSKQDNEIKVSNETKINWKRKLTSRKLWMSIASFTAMVMIFVGSPENTANQVAAIIMAGATVIGYVVGEGMADYGSNGEVVYPDQEAAPKHDDQA